MWQRLSVSLLTVPINSHSSKILRSVKLPLCTNTITFFFFRNESVKKLHCFNTKNQTLSLTIWTHTMNTFLQWRDEITVTWQLMCIVFHLHYAKVLWPKKTEVCLLLVSFSMSLKKIKRYWHWLKKAWFEITWPILLHTL